MVEDTRMHLGSRWAAGFASLLVSLLVPVTSAVAPLPPTLTPFSAPRHRPMLMHHRRDQTATSLNWGGYAVETAAGAVTDVTGSWKVPDIQGRCPATNQHAAFWVGIDGFSSNTVEQIGTDSDCQNGVPTFYAWFEFYPHPGFIINTLAVSAGDIMRAEVHYQPSSRQFTVSIENTTT